MTTEINIKVDNLEVTQIIINGVRNNQVLRNRGAYLEEVNPNEKDYKKAIIALHNYKIENSIF